MIKQKLSAEKELIELRAALKEKLIENEKLLTALFEAGNDLSFQNDEREKRAAELTIANIELEYLRLEKKKHAAELDIANIELAYQNNEKEKRAVELDIANIELEYLRLEKKKRAAELDIANIELAYQNNEKEKRAAELYIANIELEYQRLEKQKRAAELYVANIELAYQNEEKEKRAAELGIANTELKFQNEEKEKRVTELGIANFELAYQNEEKEKRAAELSIANTELLFQNKEKEKRAAELTIANTELLFQNEEKEKRAAELGIAHTELLHQNGEKEKRVAEKKALEIFNANIKLDSQYARSLIEASLDPLIVINTEGKITDVNEATVRITGLSRENLKNTDFKIYFTEPEKARLGYEEIFDKGFVTDLPLTMLDGKLTDVLFNGSVYTDINDVVLGVVVVARDVTDQKRIEKELIEARIYAELAVEIALEAKRNAESAAIVAGVAVNSKQQFLSNMSHEIRTPMNAIIGFTKVLLKTSLSVKQKEYLTAIRLSGDTLIVLINDILDLAKVDSGKMTFEEIPFQMINSISAVLHLFDTKIQEKNLELLTFYDTRIPKVLLGDSVRLNQIILNLVSNAVKFTNKGKIEVRVNLDSENTDTATIAFTITDTGIGIPENRMVEIFENFQQASSDTSRIFGGTGLGLAIVKQLVELQEGKLSVQSVVGEGSSFGFKLSFKKTDKEAEIAPDILELSKGNKDIKVLVVEDMPLNQLLIKTLLDDFGFERDVVSNGKIAIEKLESKMYDIVLMDLQMPVMNGFETTEYIRRQMLSNIPIIALTADVTTADLAKCTAVGMNDYISKPIDELLLYFKIVNWVKKPVLEISPVPSALTRLKYIDLKYLTQRTKANPALMMEMISLYLEQTPPIVDAMKQSLIDEDWVLLQSSVHKMIPSFSIMGIHPDFEALAKKVQVYATTQIEGQDINAMVQQLAAVCLQACEELTEELNLLKNIIE